MKREKVDVLVIGAGPAGTVAASMIHQAGLAVRVIEKTKFPRFVIGESLLPRCMEALQDAKLLDEVKTKNFQEKSGAKFVRKENEIADYIFSDQFTRGWSWTWQVPRADFDNALATGIRKMGIPVDFETGVTSVTFSDDGGSITTVERKDHTTEEIEADFIVDASGYGRVLPRLLGLGRPSTLEPRKALFAHVQDNRRDGFDEPNRIIILVYGPATWSWIIPFSNGIASVGIVGSHEFFDGFEGDLTEHYKSLLDANYYLRKRFGGAPLVFEPRVLESWSSISESFYGNGYVLTGNVTEFLDPIFSSGVMFATVSGHLAGTLVSRKLKGESVDWENDYTRMLHHGVNTFRAFVTAWYDGTLEKIFFAHDPDPLIKRQITSVLAGYVWDTDNPFVRDPEKALKNLVKKIEARDRFKAQQQ